MPVRPVPPAAAATEVAPTSSADFYRALFDEAYDAILLYDEHGTLLDCNQTAVRLLHTTRAQLLHDGLMAYNVPPADENQDHLLSEQMLREALLHTARTGEQFSKVWYGQHADKQRFDGWVTLHRLMLPEGLVRVQLTIRDVTQGYRRHAATALDRSQQQLRDLLSRTNLSYVLVDREGLILDVNDFFLDYTEYTRQEVLGRQYQELFAPPAERATLQQAFLKSIAEERLQDFYERTLITKSGQARMINWHAEFSRDFDGKITGILVVGRDFTDRHLAARALTDNRTRLQDFLDNAHDLIQNLSIDNRFLFVNKAWKEKLGYDDDDLPHLTLGDVVHPYYKAKLLYQLRNLYKGEKVNKLETVFLTKTGKPVHLIGSISCSWQNDEPVSTRAILHDITDRIKAERLQKVYYSIANLAISSKDLHSLYGAIHRELSKIIETNNFFIALCDEERTQLQFAYFVDQNTPGEQGLVSRPFSSGVSEYIIRTGRPQFLLRPELEELIANGTITAYGLMPEVMLCSPLSIGERIIGVITVQDYHRADAYSAGDIEILHFISNQVALAIERKGNEVKIQKQNARLNAIFESGSHLMWSVDTHSRLTSFNRNYSAYFLRRNGVYPTLNVNLWQADLGMMEDEARELFVENYRRAFQGQPQRFEVRLRDARGQDTWREIYLNPIYLDDGSFEEISGMAHDITDKKRSQLELAAQEEKFRAIFESFQDMYYRSDARGQLTLISPSVFDIMGYTPEEVMGQPLTRFYKHPEDRMRLLEELRQNNGTARNFESMLVHKDGHVLNVLVNARAMYDEQGNLLGTEGIARDITELMQMQDDLRRAKDEAEASLHAKTQFLANMSHELRTPMNGIIGMIDLLHQTVSSEEQEDYVDTLRKSSDALLSILNDILDLSKIQAGKLQLSETGVDLHYTLEKIYSLFANRANQKKLKFSYHITPHTPHFIITDETRLLQILSNLTSNAIKFTSQGTVSIVVSSVSTDGQEHVLRFAVQDSGIGISAANEKLLFTNFTQLDTTPTKSFGGTGLGLAISKQLAELLGGEIGIFSNEGDGSTFWFTMRCREAFNAEEIVQERQASRERSQEVVRFESSPRVLLVDDNLINQKVATRLLDKLGCQIDVAGDGFEAISKATNPEAHYELIFMDIQMPEMDGVTAMLEIRRRLGRLCPPIVAMTAYSMKEDAERFVQQGMDDYVSKPVKSQALYTVLRRWTGATERMATLHLTPAAESAPAAEPDAAEPAALAPPPALSEPEQAALIDPDILEQLRQLGGSDFAAQLYTDFEHEARQLLDEAQALVQAGQYEQILPHLHQLKGTGFTLGLNSLAGCAKLLEHELKEGQMQHAEANFQLLLRYFAQFTAVYPTVVSPT
ncbi:PAS domain S-box-containing protein [Hymenobacter daecheongensis DSM 21074]|uniref:histidine kinase n=1 Tax=Hymenobacter daecheongensis DSM 21074 TaxID=1121955 RepID=A0A1M6I436_9BACT|nr:PAS domain S-box protein [Hymenobacter daecheongensis]SHJ29238.1 PAS domain S-box-containing protein [Hymenobacter daecheongensis DSM 21074]